MQPEVSHSDSALKLWAWILANQKQLTRAAILIAVAALAAYLYTNHVEAREVAASEALSNVMPVRIKEAPTPAELAKAYLKVAADYPGTRAANQATLRAAGALFQDGKYEEARNQFELFVRQDPASPFVAQAAYGVAVSLDAAGKRDEAQAKYEEVTKRYASDAVVAGQAKIAMADIYTAQKKPEQAYKLLDELLQGGRRDVFVQEAFQKREELAQQFPYLRSNTPALKPPVPPQLPKLSTNAVAAMATNTAKATTTPAKP
jgi:tetratricopeptide (TPR) repeat protein